MYNSDTKVRFQPSDDSDYIPESNEVKPIQGPKPTKDFKKVMGRTGKQGKEGEEELLQKVTSKEYQEESGEEAGTIRTKKKKTIEDEDDPLEGPVSLFDLSKRAAQKERDERQGARKQTSIESSDTVDSSIKEKEAAPHEEREKFTMEEPDSKKDRQTNRYIREQPDISYVNPLAVEQATTVPPSPMIAATAPVTKPAPINTALQELVAQLVKQMYTVDKHGQTDTVITLKYPPLFQDAKIIVTSFDSAKGEFNISFENLTQAAQLLLDKEENRQSLLSALEKRGYNVHILSTTTVETAPIYEERPISHAREKEQDERQQGRDQEQEQEE
jgi:hypothetical protein